MPDTSDSKAASGIRAPYIVTTIVLVVAAIPLGILLSSTTSIEVKVVEGITTFAVLYVLAQSIERINQILVPLGDRILAAISKKPTSTVKKEQGLLAVRAAFTTTRLTSATEGSPSVAAEQAKDATDGEKTVTEANIEKALLTNALAFFLAMLVVGAFKFSLLGSIGFENVPSWLDWIITATAIMGGSAGLGDLISKIQKSKTKDEVTS